MQIIPVIDLMNGQVVHACQGQRQLYRPIHLSSQLVSTSGLYDVLDAFLRVYPFKTFYIADLDAITDSGEHGTAIRSLQERYPSIEFWIDNGKHYQFTLSLSDRFKSVIGTESLSPSPFFFNERCIISMDFRNNHLLGEPDWYREIQQAKEIIVMHLDYVGSQAGPDFDLIEKLMVTYPKAQIIAAGGVRDQLDLDQLEKRGVSKVLLASVLHQNKLQL